jgi:hippurate hydrolase
MRRTTLVSALAAALVLAAGPLLADAPAATPLAPALIAEVHRVVDADTERLTAIFKDFHQNPELAFTETRTAGIVAKELRALGYEVTEAIAKTGVVAVLRNGDGPTLWFRADMDANAVKEATGLPYASRTPQRLPTGVEVDVMHACGHDAHTTWMLGLAKAMATMRSAWSGTLVVYGQPAEEVGLGAQAMVDDGLWERGFPKPDFALGSHTAPLPVGVVSSSPGVRMAGTDQLDVTFKGRGGHGSSPHLTIDPVVMQAQAVLAYQTVVSRTLDPQAAATLTVGAVDAGRDNNVIPGAATLKLNLRWFTPEVRERMIERIDEISRGVAVANGVPEADMPTRTMKGMANPLVNNDVMVASINPSLTALVGEGRVLSAFPSVMGSEDFQEAFTPLGTPYVFMLVGVAPPEMFAKAQAAGLPFPYSNHNPDFFVDLAAIPLGTKANVVAALSLMRKSD